MKSRLPLLAVAILSVAIQQRAFAQTRPDSPAVFTQAIVVGANRSVDRELPALRYADDDAARFGELFAELGIRVHLLTRPDAATLRLHPLLANVRAPTQLDLRAAVAEAKSQAAEARLRGQKTVLYVVFAGHGNADGGRAYVTLEDARLYPQDFLEGIIAAVAPTLAHVVIDACHSYQFALSRGAGGTHRPVRGFLEGAGLHRKNVGFLLSSNPSGESHEWEAFQSGVFSHEVRSGLAGAADVNGDGTITYREMAAFVSRANEAIVNDLYRPAVHARAPGDTETLLNLPAAKGSQLRVHGTASGKHFLIEDARGVRWADFHPAQGESLSLRLPSAHLPVYVRSVADGRESVVAQGAPLVILAEQPTRAPETETRGAAHRAFKALFSLPFDRQAVASFPLGLDGETSARAQSTSDLSPSRGRKPWAIAAFTAAAAAAAGGTYYFAANRGLISSGASVDQKTAAERNDLISRNERKAAWLVGTAATAATAGLLLLLWPSSPATLDVVPSDGGVNVQLTMR